MEFWVVILIVLVIVGFIGLIIAIVLTHSNRQNSNGDYNDGGGKQVGSPGQPTFFMSTAETRGIDGERLSNFQIRKLLRNDEYLLSNLLIPLRNGHKVEIDSVIISRKVSFVLKPRTGLERYMVMIEKKLGHKYMMIQIDYLEHIKTQLYKTNVIVEC